MMTIESFFRCMKNAVFGKDPLALQNTSCTINFIELKKVVETSAILST